MEVRINYRDVKLAFIVELKGTTWSYVLLSTNWPYNSNIDIPFRIAPQNTKLPTSSTDWNIESGFSGS